MLRCTMENVFEFLLFSRYYRVLYRRLLCQEVATTSHGMQFLNVIFKAMKRDNILNRVIGFTKRLLQVRHSLFIIRCNLSLINSNYLFIGMVIFYLFMSFIAL